ncbi:MAG: molybdenum cofactor biosynthesis protein MoaE [Terrimicrobiaceae bacterium]|nr:molybdenum cofactor biosynthesis protein MoaE [Terrimicrobiaceae bacterium]
MTTEVQIQAAPITVPPATGDPGAGAVVTFEGVVRGMENGQPIRALHYEAYEPMAEREMERIAGEIAMEHAVRRMAVIHRIGEVPVGEASIAVRVEAAHRAEAFGFLTTFMDRLKRDVPIWKREVR